MASTSSAWLSVIVKRGATIVLPRRIVNLKWESSFGELMIAADPSLEKESVFQIVISTNERFIDPIHEVDIRAPVSVCEAFNCRFVCIYLRESSDGDVSILSNSGVCILQFFLPPAFCFSMTL